jgi:hypothetical protein
MPIRLVALHCQLNAKRLFFKSIRHSPGFGIVQSIFSSAARRHNFRGSRTTDRRDGELKMDWTKPLARRPPYGF